MKYPLVAKRITEAMSEKNLRAQDLANLTGINKASISQYVNGANAPSNLTAAKLSKVLGVSPMWLMGMDFDREGNHSPVMPSPVDGVIYNSKLGHIVLEASKMDEQQLDRLIKIMNALKGGDES